MIVGSGPTGLMAAALLTRCGVSVRILDKSQQQAHESRAFGVHARSMELFLNMGLAEEFLNRGLIATGMQVFVDGENMGGFNFDDIGRPDTPYSFLLMVPQWDIEAILVEDLRRFGVEVEHNVEVTGFEQSSQGVVVHAKDAAGASAQVSGSYLIGADGAHSIVRKTLGLSFQGAAYPQGFLLADCKITWPFDYDHMRLFLRGRALAIYLPLKGKDVGRIIAIDPVESNKDAPVEAQGSSELSLDEVEACPSRCVWPRHQAQRSRLDHALSHSSSGREQVRRGTGLRGRRRGAHPQPGRRAGHEHGPSGRRQSGMEAGPGAQGPCAGSPAGHVSLRALADRPEGAELHRQALRGHELAVGLGGSPAQHAGSSARGNALQERHHSRPGVSLRVAARHSLPRERLRA